MGWFWADTQSKPAPAAPNPLASSDASPPVSRLNARNQVIKVFFFLFFLTTVNSPDVQCMLQIRPPRPRRPNLILPMLVRSGLQTPRSTLPRRLRPLRMLRSLRPPKTSRPCPNITH